MYKNIVVGTDGSPGASAAVDAAIELARLTGATLHVVNAHKVMTAQHIAATTGVGIPMTDVLESNDALHAGGQKVCDEAVERAGSAGVKTEAHCLPGDAADALLQVAQDARCDLLVVGNRGMTGVRRMLGSVPKKLSHHSPASLLIVDTSQARA
jgi:nucleotide-binding universal stress UspA family protein